ncbi:MAG: hypothetical protein ACO2ON_02590 [Candidatus Nanopusillus sp.]
MVDLQIMPQTYEDIHNKINDMIQKLTKLKDELLNNKDNVKKLYEILDKIESLQTDLNLVKGFVMAQIYLNSEYVYE